MSSLEDPAQQAIDYIVQCCPTMGAFCGPTDVHRFLSRVATEMSAAKPSAVFPDRYVEHVAYAVETVATNWSTSPPAAVASVYLATRFEFYFRVLSGKLKPDGTWVSSQAQAEAQASLHDSRLGKNRISSVSLAYDVMKLNTSLAFSQRCSLLDSALFATPSTVAGGLRICDVGDRIECCRNWTGHGHWGDISSEGVFYGLMTALVFYSQP